MGTMEVILKGMRTFHQIENMQDNAVLAIQILLNSCKENAERLVNHADGITSVVAAMANFPANKGIQKDGCGIVHRCIAFLDNQNTWMNHDALAVASN